MIFRVSNCMYPKDYRGEGSEDPAEAGELPPGGGPGGGEGGGQRQVKEFLFRC